MMFQLSEYFFHLQLSISIWLDEMKSVFIET